ncbi:response regulator [Ectothiorhodospiraceae bacterium 2226]|nr:response regulator [Ectothiorhodospiraceae bacterium 2226]
MQPRSKARVLLVEDDARSRAALCAVLEDARFEVTAVSSGEEALRSLLGGEFAVILLDVQLPGIDGFETAELVRRRRRSYQTPIIFLTGKHPDSTWMYRGYEVGAVDYIVKPVVPEILKSKVVVFVDLYNKNAQIEAHKEKLRALAQRSTERFYDLVQGLDAIVWEGDPEHVFTFVSRRAEAILGYPVERWFAAREFRAKLMHPEDREAALHAYEATARGTTGTIIEYRVTRADGTLAWMRDHVHVVREAAVRTRLRGVMVDITAHKTTEHRLEEQAEQLRLADRHRNEFLAMLGHELRNPLAPIQSAVELLRLQGPTEERTRWGLDTIGRQVTHMTHLVDDLLDVARITRGKIELQRERLDLTDIVRRAIETVTPFIDDKRHALALDLAGEPLWVDGDPVRLAQVAANLLHNAAKYTEEGGEITLRVTAIDEHAVILVRDNGIGIAADMLPRVFDLFTQAEGQHRPVRGGLGVGLSLVRTLVEMHGGRVEARSPGLGRGSEFTVHLPLLAAVEVPEPDLELAGAAAEVVQRRVLVVDDNHDAADSFAQLLEVLGHEVETAADGPSALRAATDFRPEVIFLDIGLPGMDGYEVARRLRARKDSPTPHLVALTGYGRRPGAEDDERRLFDHFLLKPGDLSTVATILASLSDHSEVASSN